MISPPRGPGFMMASLSWHLTVAPPRVAWVLSNSVVVVIARERELLRGSRGIMQLHHSLRIRTATWRLAHRLYLMMRLKIEIWQTLVIPLTCTDCTRGWFCWGPNLLEVLEKVVDYAAPLPPNIPHHTNNESHLSCQHWHRSWSTNPSPHIPRRYSHEGWVTLTICRRMCPRNGHTQKSWMICSFSLLVAVLSFCIYW